MTTQPPTGALPPPPESRPDSAYPGILPPGTEAASPFLRLGAYFLETCLVVVTLFIGWMIWAVMIVDTGQTPAKRLLNLRVIDAETRSPAGLGKMFFMRGIVGGFVTSIAFTLTLGILVLMPFWDKRRMNLWDKVSGTYVVTDPNDAWHTKPELH